MNSGNSHHGNALPCARTNPMGKRAMHEGGFRKNELRNLLLKVSGSTLFDSTASGLFEALPTSASR
jgi:hypothetical protein